MKKILILSILLLSITTLVFSQSFLSFPKPKNDKVGGIVGRFSVEFDKKWFQSINPGIYFEYDIIIKNVDKGTFYTISSEKDGYYNYMNIKPGIYEITEFQFFDHSHRYNYYLTYYFNNNSFIQVNEKSITVINPIKIKVNVNNEGRAVYCRTDLDESNKEVIEYLKVKDKKKYYSYYELIPLEKFILDDIKNWIVVFNESFDDNKNNWQIKEKKNEEKGMFTDIKNGEYYCSFNAEKNIKENFVSENYILTYINFYLTVNVKQLEGKGYYGLYFLQKGVNESKNNYFVFTINEEKKFYNFEFYTDKYSPIISKKYSEHILRNKNNKLSIIAKGYNIYLFINDKLVNFIQLPFLVNFHSKSKPGIAIEADEGESIITGFDDFTISVP